MLTKKILINNKMIYKIMFTSMVYIFEKDYHNVCILYFYESLGDSPFFLDATLGKISSFYFRLLRTIFDRLQAIVDVHSYQFLMEITDGTAEARPLDFPSIRKIGDHAYKAR